MIGRGSRTSFCSRLLSFFLPEAPAAKAARTWSGAAARPLPEGAQSVESSYVSKIDFDSRRRDVARRALLGGL